MANVDRPNGFRPVKHLSGAPYNGAFSKYYSGTDNLFMGDLVEISATGLANGSGAYPECARAEADDIVIGAVVGWEVDPASPSRLYHAASSTYAVYVADAPDLIFMAQTNDAGLAAADVGLNCDFVVAAGSTTSGVSNMEVDGSTEATTQAEPLKLMGMVNSPDNEVGVANMKVLVMINQHSYNNEAGTTGI